MLESKDYRSEKLDKETRAQLFQLFIEGKFAEFEAWQVANQEALKALRGDMSSEWGENQKKFAEINKELSEIANQILNLKTETKPKVKSWKFWK